MKTEKEFIKWLLTDVGIISEHSRHVIYNAAELFFAQKSEANVTDKKVNITDKIINLCIKVLNKHFRTDYKFQDIKGKNRCFELTTIRKCISYFLVEYGMSQEKIALEMNYGHHSSVISNAIRIKQYKEIKDKKFMDAFNKVEIKIKELNENTKEKEACFNKKCKEFLKKMDIEIDLLLLDDYLEYEIEGFRIKMLKEFIKNLQNEL